MKKISFWCPVVLQQTFIGIIVYFVVRTICRSIGISGIVGELIKLLLTVVCTKKCIRWVIREEPEELNAYYITKPCVSKEGIVLAVLIPISVVFLCGAIGEVEYIYVPIANYVKCLFPIAIENGMGSAICEEMIFRGYLLKSTERQYGSVFAIIWVSVVFGLLHLLNGLMPVAECFLVWIYTTSVSILLALLTITKNNIWDSVLIHMFINICDTFINIANERECLSPIKIMFENTVYFGFFRKEYFAYIIYIAIIWLAIFLNLKAFIRAIGDKDGRAKIYPRSKKCS